MKVEQLCLPFGPQAGRLGIRQRVRKYLRGMAVVFAGMGAAALVWLAYHYVQSFAGMPPLEPDTAQRALAEQNARLELANAALKSELAVLGRQLQIERAAQVELGKQVKAMSQENSRLEEDVALLQAVSASGSKTDGISVSSVRVEPSLAPGEYTYRIVLVQTGSRVKPFRGTYQLVINVVQDGRRIGMSVPEAAGKASGTYKLDFRLHHRIDGIFKVAPGAEVRSVEVRVFEGGRPQPKVMQTVAVS